MPATPAWPPASTPRLYVEAVLAEGLMLVLEGAQANYLANVMRLKAGDPVRLFDDSTGEWLAEVADAAKRNITLRLTTKLRAREAVPDIWLLFAPLKKDPLHYLVEKATELGVARLQPVVTHRTIVDRPNPERLRAHMIEAAEQCDRTALPELAEPVKLAALLASWPAGRALLFADEGGGEPFADIAPGPAALLIGPEGGFTEDERGAIRAHASATPISLGPRILRAETAAAAGLAAWMSRFGDWR
ncbi:16S rRNA (uracil(1498)-N(3))-methyltransferase [Sphingomonas sp. BIUV-7]|uniref:Ribosomal RNA small subunit methyltransferase E n=1 Tax=Sphingomonas natans TaxID=3063330 RepID=A0ABT8Y668_9SPHN|nr:16S rRNA (uracil(1498)-N(3))-methyltransferase [Sphingomonas sp. BIUV-7]MDO6413814.1 16S rRNA (uracil(1498)-N(3))-methyltransferase [Sphingomonas sp. BIUV-7]